VKKVCKLQQYMHSPHVVFTAKTYMSIFGAELYKQLGVSCFMALSYAIVS